MAEKTQAQKPANSNARPGTRSSISAKVQIRQGTSKKKT
jgi:hypothetical protein